MTNATLDQSSLHCILFFNLWQRRVRSVLLFSEKTPYWIPEEDADAYFNVVKPLLPSRHRRKSSYLKIPLSSTTSVFPIAFELVRPIQSLQSLSAPTTRVRRIDSRDFPLLYLLIRSFVQLRRSDCHSLYFPPFVWSKEKRTTKRRYCNLTPRAMTDSLIGGLRCSSPPPNSCTRSRHTATR